MRPSEVSNEAIIAAGEALVASGRSVTGFALRQRVGGGNPTRMRQVWDEHIAASAKPPEPAADLPVEVADELARVTGDLTGRLLALVTELNDKAVRAAERRTGALVQQASEQRQQAERELADAGNAVEELENGLAEAQSENERLRAALEECQGRAQAQAVELAKASEALTHERQQVERLTADLADAKRSALDAAKLQGKIDALTEQNTALLSRLAAGGSRK
jgi:predicted  nucleic acid-binding Zn-ribbon protein